MGSVVGDGVCDVVEESVEDLGGIVHHLLGLEAVLVGLPGIRFGFQVSGMRNILRGITTGFTVDCP